MRDLERDRRTAKENSDCYHKRNKDRARFTRGQEQSCACLQDRRQSLRGRWQQAESKRNRRDQIGLIQDREEGLQIDVRGGLWKAEERSRHLPCQQAVACLINSRSGERFECAGCTKSLGTEGRCNNDPSLFGDAPFSGGSIVLKFIL